MHSHTIWGLWTNGTKSEYCPKVTCSTNISKLCLFGFFLFFSEVSPQPISLCVYVTVVSVTVKSSGLMPWVWRWVLYKTTYYYSTTYIYEATPTCDWSEADTLTSDRTECQVGSNTAPGIFWPDSAIFFSWKFKTQYTSSPVYRPTLLSRKRHNIMMWKT